MSTATLEANHTLRSRLHAENVDTAHGIIRGATVAKSGVQATGKFVMLDAKGAITRDPALMVSEVPVWTDETTLSSLMAAAQAAGKKVKSREDHVDAVGARLGFADTFKQTDDGRVVADIHLLKSYKNRELVLETAIESPEEIGLSIDFTPTFELKDGKAFMRVLELHAVDVVDEGAVTPGGLFLSASVDTGRKVETAKASPLLTMASPTPEEIMSSLGALSTAVGALTKTVGEMQTKMNAAPAAPAPDANAVAALAAVNELKEQFSAQKQEIVRLKKTSHALGFRAHIPAEELATLANGSPEDIDKMNKERSEKKNYLQLVAERAETAKCKKSEAHQWVMKNHKAEYAAHLASKGVVRIAA
jgi:hypothetical protein